jgi:hypothetical protein
LPWLLPKRQRTTLISSDATKVNRLTPRDRIFLLGYIEGKTATDAYLVIRPEVTRETARVLACRMLKRILKKVDWPRLLEEAGLGEMRLVRELNKRLNAMITKYWQDKSLGDFEDNSTRMRATELLADLLGKRKSEVAITGGLEIRTADMSPEEREAWIEKHLEALGKLLETRGWKRPEGQDNPEKIKGEQPQ